MQNELIFDDDKIKEANQDNEWLKALVSGEVKKKHGNTKTYEHDVVSLNQLRAVRR